MRRFASTPITPALTTAGATPCAIKGIFSAIADYDRAILVNPNYTNAYNSRGNAWRDKGEFGKAIADYNEAIRIDPKLAPAYNDRGNAWDNKRASTIRRSQTISRRFN